MPQNGSKNVPSSPQMYLGITFRRALSGPNPGLSLREFRLESLDFDAGGSKARLNLNKPEMVVAMVSQVPTPGPSNVLRKNTCEPEMYFLEEFCQTLATNATTCEI